MTARTRSLVTLGGTAAVMASLTGCAGTNSAPERVTVPAGATFGAVTDTLAAHGVIASRRVFKLFARIRRVDRTVQAGVYEFSPGTPPWEVLDVLAKGAAVSQKFTVPEGLTIPEVAILAAQRLGLPQDTVLNAATDGAAASALLGYPVRSFEGFLRPETYTLPLALGADDLVRIMAEAFKSGWEPAWTARLDSIGMSQLQLVTFASVVEGEARLVDPVAQSAPQCQHVCDRRPRDVADPQLSAPG